MSAVANDPYTALQAPDAPFTSNGAPQTPELEQFLAGAPIFYQPWWLEATAPGKWDHAVARIKGNIAGVLPYVRDSCHLGQLCLGMPPLTQTLGPWLRESDAKYNRRLTEQKEVMFALIDALPPYARFEQKFHYSITNWLPFYWRQFKQTTRYTYVLEDLRDPDALWKNFDPDIRWNIRKAQKQVVVRDDLGLDRFLDVCDLSFARQGIKPPWPRSFVARVTETCRQHNAGKMFFAVDAQERLHAVLYMIWTEYAAYYILGGGDPDLRQSGANCLLLWEAIQFARQVTGTFDFEGSMVEPIERFFRLFGARQKPYFQITGHRNRFIKASFAAGSLAWGWVRRFRVNGR